MVLIIFKINKNQRFVIKKSNFLNNTLMIDRIGQKLFILAEKN